MALDFIFKDVTVGPHMRRLIVFLYCLCTSRGFTITGRLSTVWIPGNRREHFLCRWDLILLGDFFYCFINTGHQFRQTIPNNPQRKSSVFIQLCLMTVLLLPCVAFIIAHNAQHGVGHPASNTAADLRI